VCRALLLAVRKVHLTGRLLNEYVNGIINGGRSNHIILILNLISRLKILQFRIEWENILLKI
jgi:hypothetical protein